MTEVEQPELQDWTDQLKKLLIAVNIANENGLFSDSPDKYKATVSEIVDALAGLSGEKPNIAEAKKKFSSAYNELNSRANLDKFRWWRFSYYYCVPALLYLLAFFLAILSIWFCFGASLLDYNILWVPSWAFLWGAMGGVLNGFWRVWQHAWLRIFRKVWYTWYIVLPLMGAILGAITYLIVLAGLIAITGESAIQSQFFIMLLCALGGFSAKWAVDLLDKLTKVVQTKG